MENVERYGFFASDNLQLNDIKNEVLHQIQTFPFDITAKGYFTFNRQLLVGVSYFLFFGFYNVTIMRESFLFFFWFFRL